MHTELGVFAKHISRATPEELFDALAGFGLDCTQFNAACLGIPSLPDQIDIALWRRAARAAQAAGIKVVALSATFNLLDQNKSRLTDNFRRLKVLAEAARILGTDLLTLCTGTRNEQDMWAYHPENQSSAAWQEMINAMRLDIFADDLIAFMDHLQVKSAVLGGISTGAAVALNAVVRYPERCVALVLVRPAWLNGSMCDCSRGLQGGG
jgi:sugar phosphate isomerase/epimerase